jgi:hypothetical protein
VKNMDITGLSHSGGFMGAVIAAVVAAMVSIAIAIGTYFTTKSIELSKHYRSLRSESYAALLESVAKVAIYQRDGSPEAALEGLANVTAAKGRIAIFGSAGVAKALADFFAEYGALSSPEAIRSFVQVAAAMRSETPGGIKAVPPEVIDVLLFR